MKKIFKNRLSIRETFHMTKLLFMAQLQPFKKNLAVGLVFLGLLLLPPLYAWFNIAANWAPYDLTSNLQVAVTSLDKGTDLEGVSVNVGDKIVESLKANDNIGWQFVSYDEGQMGVHSGKYYAALVIPADFSQQITGFLYGDTEIADIDYYINEKQNAISSKIMGTGMDAVSREINKAFVETVSTIVLDGLKIAEGSLEEYKPSLVRMIDTMDLTAKNMDLFVENMNEFKNMMEEMDGLVDNAETVLPDASQALKDASDLTLSAQDTLQSTKSTINDIEHLLGQSVAGLKVFGNQLSGMAHGLEGVTEEDANVVKSTIQDAVDETNNLREQVQTLASNLDRFNDMSEKPSENIDAFINKLNILDQSLEKDVEYLIKLKGKVGDGTVTVAFAVKEVDRVVSDVNGDLDGLTNMYNSSVASSIRNSTNHLNNTLNSSYKLLQGLSGLIPQVDGTLATVKKMQPIGIETINRYKEIIESSQKIIERETKEIRSLSDDEKLNEAIEFIQQDVEKQSAFLSNPVQMKTNRIFPVDNYGSGMSPFYTTLAIWVGCLLMMAMISPINEIGIEMYPNASVTPMYLSRLALYQIISMLQCFIIAVGDLFFLKVECMHPWLFVLLCILIGQIFSIFIFSLVFTFSAIGKAFAIVTLVLQIAASGGTFPIEMTPLFFQIIHPLLPFTYCIGAMREVCFGIYGPAFAKDLTVMALIPIISVALVIIFGPILRKFVNFFESSMKKSGLM